MDTNIVNIHKYRLTGHFRVPKILNFKTRLNLSYENEFYLQEIKSHFYMNGFALSLALTQRLRVTWKWPTAHGKPSVFK